MKQIAGPYCPHCGLIHVQPGKYFQHNQMHTSDQYLSSTIKHCLTLSKTVVTKVVKACFRKPTSQIFSNDTYKKNHRSCRCLRE